MNKSIKKVTIDGRSKFDLLGDIKNLNTGDDLFFFSNGVLSSRDVLFELISNQRSLGNQKLDVMISTWQLGVEDARQLVRLRRDSNINLKILLDVSFQDRNKKYFKYVKENLGDVVWFTKNHCKILAVGSENMKYTVLSSANFNRNFRFEFFEIKESLERYGRILENHAHFFKEAPISKNTNKRPIIVEKFKRKFIANKSNNNIIVGENSDINFDVIDIPEIILN